MRCGRGQRRDQGQSPPARGKAGTATNSKDGNWLQSRFCGGAFLEWGCYTKSGMPAAAGINISELAGDRGVRECLQWFTREKQWINEIHLQLDRKSVV